MKLYQQVFFTASVIVSLSILSCGKNKNSADGPERPSQPWVFRSVLDSQSRILTFALHDDLWAAYRTDSCSLYKVWKGDVHLQGAVYDNAHGPQPISIGNAWIVNPHQTPWSVSKDGSEVLTEVRYAGHAIKDGHAHLMYDLICNDGTVIRIHEQPEAIAEKDGQIGFERKFTMINAPKGYDVTIDQYVSSIAMARNIDTNGKWKAGDEIKDDFEGKQVLNVNGKLTLNNDETFFKTLFINSPTIQNSNKRDDNIENISVGEKLIAKNDCKTCHNAKVQTVGPAYLHIAQKYPYNDESVTMLTDKIIKGGTGVWGTQMMSPHPELPVTDAQEMVRYILSLDTTDAGQDDSGSDNPVSIITDMKDGKDLLPGLVVEAYTGQTGHQKIPTIPITQQPQQAGILTDFQGLDAIDFGGLTEDFILIATGFLYAQ